jgi:hypothetical protein
VTDMTPTEAAPAQSAKKMMPEQIAFAVERRRAARREEWQMQAKTLSQERENGYATITWYDHCSLNTAAGSRGVDDRRGANIAEALEIIDYVNRKPLGAFWRKQNDLVLRVLFRRGRRRWEHDVDHSGCGGLDPIKVPTRPGRTVSRRGAMIEGP